MAGPQGSAGCRTVACVLGGPERRTLFCITNAYMSITDAAKHRSGRVETLRVDVPGAGRP